VRIGSRRFERLLCTLNDLKVVEGVRLEGVMIRQPPQGIPRPPLLLPDLALAEEHPANVSVPDRAIDPDPTCILTAAARPPRADRGHRPIAGTDRDGNARKDVADAFHAELVSWLRLGRASGARPLFEDALHVAPASPVVRHRL